MKITDYLNVLAKRDESITVAKFSNGYMVEVPGRDERDDWITVKIVCNELSDVHAVLEVADSIEVNR